MPDIKAILVRHKGSISFTSAFSGLVLVTAAMRIFPESAPAFMGVLQTGFEAGTVGGAADWLAVKMIFDEIRIGRWRVVPASGIIPRKQQAIAEGAGRLVATEWLSPESIQRLLKTMDASSVIAEYLDQWHRGGGSSEFIRRAFDKADELLAEAAAQEALGRLVEEFRERFRLSRAMGDHVSDEQVCGLMEQIVPFLCDKLAGLLTTPEAFQLIHGYLVQEQDSFFKKLLYDPIEATEKVIVKATALLRDIEVDAEHPLRERITGAVVAWTERVQTDRDEAGKLDAMGNRLLEVLTVDTWARSVLDAVRAYLRKQKENADGGLNRAVRAWIQTVIDRLRMDTAWKNEINEQVAAAAGTILGANHHRVAELVAENIRQLSPEEIKAQFKSRTYDDMQWIRVNGAVAGFAIGILIGLIRWLLL